MQIDEARKTIRKIAKDLGIKINFRCYKQRGFDFIANISGDAAFEEKFMNACRKAGMLYEDPNADTMSDYFGIHNTMMDYNGHCYIK